MDSEKQEEKQLRWEWIPILLAMLLSFFCVFSSTAMALMSQPDQLDDASMLPVGTANYSKMDDAKFRQVGDAIFADATQDSASLRLTPANSGEVSGNRKTPIYIAFVTPSPSETPVPEPVIVTMSAPGAVPTRKASPTAIPTATATRRLTRTPQATATNTRWPLLTVTPYSSPTATSTTPPSVPTSTSIPHSATKTAVPTSVPTTTRQPNTPTNTPTATNTRINTPTPTATNTRINTPTSTSTPTRTPVNTPTNTPTATATATATAANTPTSTNTATATAVNTPTSTNTPTATAVNTPTSTPTATAVPSVRVLSIALVNADIESVIPGYETMPDGITLDLTTLPTENLNMWATLDPQYAHHVDVFLDGIYHHTEFYYPYTFPGNTYVPGDPMNDFWGYNFAPGSYTLTFNPYVDETTIGIPFVFHFTIIRSTVSSVSPLLARVTNDGGGNCTAVFGYTNSAAFEMTIPVGPNNRFQPAPEDRGQPTAFHVGTTAEVISLPFTSSSPLSWIINATAATATCP